MYCKSVSFSYFCSMHRFIEYISDLLLLHDCVIMPEFGGFICNYKSAYIDDESGMILPPAKEIAFNRSLKQNDGLLVNWVASKENISYEKATKQVELFCEELKVKLNQRHRVAFGDIGVFYTDRRFNIIFESAENNFLADAFGMEKIEAKKVVQEEKKSAPTQINIPSASELSPYIINMESQNWVHRMLKFGLAVAVIAGIVFLSHLGYIYWGNSHYQQGGLVTTTIQPVLPQIPGNAQAKSLHVVISPDYDYVDYDPLAIQ